MKSFNKKLTLCVAFAAIAASSLCENQELLFPKLEVDNAIISKGQELNPFIPKKADTLPAALAEGKNENDAQAAATALVVDSIGSTMNFINNVLAIKSFYELSLTAWSVTKATTVFVSAKAQAGLALAANTTSFVCLPAMQHAVIFAAAHPGLIPFVGVVILTTALLRNKDAAFKVKYAENAKAEGMNI